MRESTKINIGLGLIVISAIALIFWIGFVAGDLRGQKRVDKNRECGEYTKYDFNWVRIPARCEKEIKLFHYISR